MKKNVFLRSTLRQPVKTAMLLLVTALITFAFVARVSEYLLVKQETECLGDTYTASGILTGPWLDTNEAVAYLEAREDVDVVNICRYVPAVMEDYFNADTEMNSPSYFIDRVVFYGTLHSWHTSFNQMEFTVDEVIAGYPEYFEKGRTVFAIQDPKYAIEDSDSAYAKLESGGRYLVCGYFDPSYMPVVDDGKVHSTWMLFYPLFDDGFFLSVPEGQEPDWDTPGIRDWRPERIAALNIPLSQIVEAAAAEYRALNMIAAADMSVLPEIIEEDPDVYLVDGRWLDGADTAEERRVCVLNAALAAMRGLTVGDTLELTLRDVPYTYTGYYFPPYTENIVNNNGTLTREPGAPDPSWKIFFDPQTSTDTYEIVGLYDYVDGRQNTLFRNNAYIPASAVPESFVHVGIDSLEQSFFVNELQKYYTSGLLTQPDQVSFTLTSPDITAQFLTEARNDLAGMGFEIEFLENGWASFQAAAKPMRQSALLNAVIFTGVLLAALCLIVLIYFRMHRKDIAIARALGMPALRCVREAAFPLALLGVLGVGAGGWLGWMYTLHSAADILSPLGGAVGEIGLPIVWLAVLSGGALVLLVLAATGGAAFLSSRPTLTLLQGDAPVVRNQAVDIPSPGAAAALSAPAAIRAAASSPVQTQKAGCAHILRFVWRHIARSKLKTALAVLLAAGFTVGLAVIHLSIQSSQKEINWLYENTPVEAELVQADTSQSLRGTGFLRRDTLDALLESGYVTDAYVEGTARGAAVRYTPDMVAGQSVSTSKSNVINGVSFCGFADLEKFLSPSGSGGTIEIEYLDGWDGSFFAQEWTEGKIPVILPKVLFLQLGRTVGLSCGGFYECSVAGYYEGETIDRSTPVLIPLSAYQVLSGSRNAYSKAHITLDPSLNRELDRFNAFLTELSASQGVGAIALRAIIWDEELTQAVAPLENSVELMRVLYPVTLVLSLFVAAGIAVLFVMTSAKEAAIMRVLGTSKLRSRVMLALQTVFTSAAGLLVGLLGVLAYTGRARPDLFANLLGASALCAMLYLLAAVIGAAASAAVVTGRNPLELLQVKE